MSKINPEADVVTVDQLILLSNDDLYRRLDYLGQLEAVTDWPLVRIETHNVANELRERLNSALQTKRRSS